MPRFFFEVQDGGILHRDHIGSDLPDANEARKEAIATLVLLARDELPDGDHHIFSASVRDEAGSEIYRASLALNGGWVKKEPVRWFWP